MANTRRTHTRDFKRDLCSRIEAGEISKARACREYALAPSMLDRWCEQLRERGQQAFTNSPSEEGDKDKRIAQLEQALGQAHLEMKIMKAALEKRGPAGHAK